MTTRSANLNQRPSLQSLTGPRGSSDPTSATGRPFRPCADCTCSPGLLSRAGRRSSMFLRQLENNRRRCSRELAASGAARTGSQESVYSSDSLCQSTREVNTTQRLLALRRQMVKHELCCYVVLSEDEHQSEYVSAADQRRAFISGFNGSAGVACITRDLLNFNKDQPDGKSILSTDGRYFNQASQELDYNWTLVRQGVDSFTWQEWCVREAAEMSRGLGGKPARIGVDPRLISYEQVVQFNKLIKAKLAAAAAAAGTAPDADVQLVPVDENLIDAIWPQFEEPPKKELKGIMVLPEEYAGQTLAEKRDHLHTCLNKNHAGTPLAVVALDEVCWLLNLRGSDIAYNPVFYAYVVVDPAGSITLFTDNPLSSEVQHYCSQNEVQLQPYEKFWLHVRGHRFLVPDNASWQLIRTAGSYEAIHSPVDLFKSVKNATEIKNARVAQVKDAIALVQYFAWLEDQLLNHSALIDEYRAAVKLKEIRRTQKGFMGNSFETISSTGANAAIIHYAPPEVGSAMINPQKIYLCDSGAQYLHGTTDITRTLHFATPTSEERHRYTLVLRGHLALERLMFPEGSTGFHIDAIARQALWSEGLDYRHGTGHGIGSFLNVHEGPVGIGPRPALLKHALQPGNLLSNEPGYYKDGEYGIRLESDVLVVRSEQHRRFLQFENLTVIPYCRSLVETSLLTREELQQINAYHARVWRTLVPYLQPLSIAYKWLKRETAEM